MSGPQSFSVRNEWEDAISPPPEDSAQNLHFSDSDDDADGIEEEDAHTGDYSHYSQQMEELLGDEEHDSADESKSPILASVLESDNEEEEEEEEDFVYSGVDAADVSVVPYRDQLRDVLEQDHEEEGVEDVHEAEKSLLMQESGNVSVLLDDEPLVSARHLSHCPYFSTLSTDRNTMNYRRKFSQSSPLRNHLRAQ
jgi:hypothetical protein